MPGIFTIQCIETENNYIGQADQESVALEIVEKRLQEGKFWNSSLEDEWNEYGKEAFEMGCPVHFDKDEENIELQIKEEIEEWMDILENVEYLGKIDEVTGDRIDG